MMCDDCGSTVELARNQRNQLNVKCACTARSVKVSNVLPEAWQ